MAISLIGQVSYSRSQPGPPVAQSLKQEALQGWSQVKKIVSEVAEIMSLPVLDNYPNQSPR